MVGRGAASFQAATRGPRACFDSILLRRANSARPEPAKLHPKSHVSLQVVPPLGRDPDKAPGPQRPISIRRRGQQTPVSKVAYVLQEEAQPDRAIVKVSNAHRYGLVAEPQILQTAVDIHETAPFCPLLGSRPLPGLSVVGVGTAS